mmetsp:Transcript_99854/g.287089  ORF Transcript_99854/g.287089 Transcript_99854/m.287089 type:complete len:306 (+) Transcript_99854:931-1848(+)
MRRKRSEPPAFSSSSSTSASFSSEIGAWAMTRPGVLGPTIGGISCIAIPAAPAGPAGTAGCTCPGCTGPGGNGSGGGGGVYASARAGGSMGLPGSICRGALMETLSVVPVSPGNRTEVRPSASLYTSKSRGRSRMSSFSSVALRTIRDSTSSLHSRSTFWSCEAWAKRQVRSGALPTNCDSTWQKRAYWSLFSFFTWLSTSRAAAMSWSCCSTKASRFCDEDFSGHHLESWRPHQSMRSCSLNFSCCIALNWDSLATRSAASAIARAFHSSMRLCRGIPGPGDVPMAAMPAPMPEPMPMPMPVPA